MEDGEEKSLRDKLAVAIAYDKEKESAPHVAAKGQGLLAERIIEIAREHQVEIRKDADLAQLLSKIEVDAPIPLEAYAAVAEILAYVYKINDAMKKG